MAAFLDVCRFNPTSGGTSDWTYASAVTGYQSPAAAGAVNGATYSYRAESSDLSQWEVGYGTYNTGVLTRTAVLFNSVETTSKISFSAAPQVAVVALSEDLVGPSILQNHISGLNISPSDASFAVSRGVASDSTNSTFLKLASDITKTTGAWAVGNGNGGLDTGAIAANTWYHVYLIARLDTGVVDVAFSISASAPSLPANYTIYRHIGFLRSNASSQFIGYIQDGDDVLWMVPVNDVTAYSPGTGAVIRTLSVPSGKRVKALLAVGGFGVSGDTGPNVVYISDLSLSDQPPEQTSAVSLQIYAAGASTVAAIGPVTVMTNTSAQVRSRVQGSTANSGIIINTLGWNYTRGRA